MTLILISQLLFGNLSVIRILREFHQRSMLNTHALTKIGTLFLFIMNFSLMFLLENLVLIFLLLIFYLIALIFSLRFLERDFVQRIRERIPYFLDRWILNLRLGRSPRVAREIALANENPFFARAIQAFFATGELARVKKHLFLSASLRAQLLQVEAQPHCALARLQNLRSILRQSDQFRRRSGQILRQTHLQAIIMMILQALLTVFVIVSYGIQKNWDLLLISTLLSLLGFFVLLRLGRKKSWRI